tara:strand:+ start:1807 stop:3498 length:1692 start_codon:yes stop_codon:yes gene_type:complete
MSGYANLEYLTRNNPKTIMDAYKTEVSGSLNNNNENAAKYIADKKNGIWYPEANNLNDVDKSCKSLFSKHPAFASGAINLCSAELDDDIAFMIAYLTSPNSGSKVKGDKQENEYNGAFSWSDINELDNVKTPDKYKMLALFVLTLYLMGHVNKYTVGQDPFIRKDKIEGTDNFKIGADPFTPATHLPNILRVVYFLYHLGVQGRRTSEGYITPEEIHEYKDGIVDALDLGSLDNVDSAEKLKEALESILNTTEIKRSINRVFIQITLLATRKTEEKFNENFFNLVTKKLVEKAQPKNDESGTVYLKRLLEYSGFFDTLEGYINYVDENKELLFKVDPYTMDNARAVLGIRHLPKLKLPPVIMYLNNIGASLQGYFRSDVVPTFRHVFSSGMGIPLGMMGGPMRGGGEVDHEFEEFVENSTGMRNIANQVGGLGVFKLLPNQRNYNIESIIDQYRILLKDVKNYTESQGGTINNSYYNSLEKEIKDLHTALNTVDKEVTNLREYIRTNDNLKNINKNRVKQNISENQKQIRAYQKSLRVRIPRAFAMTSPIIGSLVPLAYTFNQ